jgi:hypothetical protein
VGGRYVGIKEASWMAARWSYLWKWLLMARIESTARRQMTTVNFFFKLKARSAE